MHISNLEVKLTEKDILSIINDFVKVDNLNIKSITLNNSIILKGTYKSLINLNFKVDVNIYEFKGNLIKLKINSIKLWKVGVFPFVRNIAIKFALKKLNKDGIKFENKFIIIDVDKLLKSIPYISLDMSSLLMEPGAMKVKLEDINLSLGELLSKSHSLAETTEETSYEEIMEPNGNNEEVISYSIEKTSDVYTEVRNNIATKIPEKYENITDYAFVIPDILALLIRLFKDKRVKLRTKVTLALCIAYITSPYEIIPDKVPFIGKLDDIGVAVFGLSRVIEDVPKEIILSNWEGDNTILMVLESSLTYLMRFTTGAKIEKVYNFMDDIITV